MRKIVVVGTLCLALVVVFRLAVGANGGPPPYLTTPLRERVPDAATQHGHEIFTREPPPPFAPDFGEADYLPADPGSAALITGLDRNVSGKADSYEGETTAATIGSVIVAGSNHLFPGACNAAAAPGSFGDCAPLAYTSRDGGATWKKASMPRVWNGVTFAVGFDPALDTSADGTIYYSYIVAPVTGNYPNAIVVVSWNKTAGVRQLTPVTFNNSQNFDDKQYIAVDRSAGPFSGRVYVTWDRNRSLNQTLYLSYSSNSGDTWSAPIKVNDGTTPFERVIGAYPAVDPQTGVVYNSWHDYAKGRIFVDKSLNGGVSWGPDVSAALTHTGFGTDIGCVGGRAQSPSHAIRVGSTGTLYLVYADAVAGRGFDIQMTTSTNGGATWSPPMTINDDPGAADQFQPTISVEPNGIAGDKITVTFYDRRDDPANCNAHVYATQSLDNGVSWSVNVRQTSAASNFDGNPNGPGDYSSSIPFGGAVWPFFGDHRPSNPETSTGGAFDIYTVDVR